MSNGNGQQTAQATAPPQPPPDLSGLRIRPVDELQLSTLAQARAALPQPQTTEETFANWEKQQQEQWAAQHPILPPTSRLGQAYAHLKSLISEHEGQISEHYLAPFRQTLDRMGQDLIAAGETGHTRTGGQLTTPARLLTLGVGHLLGMVPVGHDVQSTIAANIVPPEFPEGKALSKELKATQAAEKQFNEFRVSTRVPEGKAATEHPLQGEPLMVGLEAVKKAPEKLQDRFVNSISRIAGFTVPKNIKDRDKIFQRFTRHTADNLK